MRLTFLALLAVVSVGLVSAFCGTREIGKERSGLGSRNDKYFSNETAACGYPRPRRDSPYVHVTWKTLCTRSYFYCKGTDPPRCLPPAWVCDGKKDCDDGSDEFQGCVCQDHLFQCKSTGPAWAWTSKTPGTCITRDLFCNGVKDCPDGSDEPEDCACEPTYFHCKGTKPARCIPRSRVCDEVRDCTDGFDEYKDCECDEKYHFKCNRSGRCIDRLKKCDGYKNCYNDGSDEPEDCVCQKHQFECKSPHRCIPREWVCNGGPDCADESDEPENCYYDMGIRLAILWNLYGHEVECPKHLFRCERTGRCINRSLVCNGVDDCIYGSDEPKDCARKMSVRLSTLWSLFDKEVITD